MKELSLGGQLTDWSDTIDNYTPFWGWNVGQRLTTYVTDQEPTNDAKPRALFKTGDSYIRHTAKHCNFEGDDCWNVRVHPVIDSISAATGYVTGGQALKINGFGLNGKAEVTVDGVPCEVFWN
jgi:hypothetical protein